MQQLPAGSREEGHLEQRLFTFLSWLWAGQAIFKLFLLFFFLRERAVLLPEVLVSSLCKKQGSCGPARSHQGPPLLKVTSLRIVLMVAGLCLGAGNRPCDSPSLSCAWDVRLQTMFGSGQWPNVLVGEAGY